MPSTLPASHLATARRKNPGQAAGWAHRRTRRLAPCMGLVLWIAGSARAQPILHEYVELGPGPGAVAPPARRAPVESAPVAGASRVGEAGGGAPAAESDELTISPQSAPSYRIDRDTSRADRVSYDDPFTPSVAPFKRSVVYDVVDSVGDLSVRDRSLRPIPSGASDSPSDENFHAAFDLELRAGKVVPIPSVAPGARVVVKHEQPGRGIELGMDSAENWYVRSRQSGRVTLQLQLAVDRGVFVGGFADSSWAALSPHLPPVPALVRESALEVARALGIDRTRAPAQTLESLVHHFRRFRPSNRMPQGRGLALYRELALTARGICRHRAYAFMITALGLGIPTRLVLNEAHAWVEVRDERSWHRIDLGGAANEVSLGNPARPRHVAPEDPLSWPEGSDGALATLDAPGGDAAGMRSAAGGPERGPSASAASTNDASGRALESDPTSGDGSSPSPTAGPGEPGDGAASDDAARARRSPVPDEPTRATEGSAGGARRDDSTSNAAAVAAADALAPREPTGVRVALHVQTDEALRGRTVPLRGDVRRWGHRCAGATVELELILDDSTRHSLGKLVTDAAGRFQGRLVIPRSVPVGDHVLGARVVDAASCASP